MPSRLIRIIAWWEIACGIVGIAMFGALYFGILPNGQASFEIMGPVNYYAGVAFFSFVVAAGRALLNGSHWGVGGSTICQVLQVVSVAIQRGPHVQIQAGPLLGIKLSTNYAELTGGFYSAFFLGTRVVGPPFELTVNVLAAIWAIHLCRTWMHVRSAAAEAAP